MNTREPFRYNFKDYNAADMQSLVNDTRSYGAMKDAEAAAMIRNKEIHDKQMRLNDNIIDLDSKIDALRKRNSELDNVINYDPTDAIVVADMLKISEPGQSRDATMVWRWNEARKDAEKERQYNRDLQRMSQEKLHAEAQNNFIIRMRNRLSAPVDTTSTAAINQEVSNLLTLKSEGEQLGMDVSSIDERITQLTGGKAPTPTDGNTPAGDYAGTKNEQTVAAAKEALKTGSIRDIVAAIENVAALKDEKNNELIRNLKERKKELKKEAEAKAKAAKEKAATENAVEAAKALINEKKKLSAFEWRNWCTSEEGKKAFATAGMNNPYGGKK